MRVIRKGSAPAERGTTFTGETTLERYLSGGAEGISLSVVHFSDGSRTHWHEHPGEQILYILDGRGRVGTENEESEVGPGDVIYTGPGERHWHGAAPGASMTHISITRGGPPVWGEPPE